MEKYVVWWLLTAPYGYYINSMSTPAAPVANDAVSIDDRNVIMTSWRNDGQSANSRQITSTAQTVNS